jgi:hypothetical protein
VHIPDIWKHRAHEIWAEKVFELLLDEYKIDEDTVAGMKLWKHSGFSVDNSVRIEAGDQDSLQRLTEYIARCPFSLGRMISGNADGSVVYRSTKGKCLPFPLTGDDGSMKKGIPRNFHIYDPLEFLAEVTQHIPNKGEHKVRYYGFYSNKKRGVLRKQQKGRQQQSTPAMPESDETAASRKFRMTWAALIMCVYEVDPLTCPNCGSTMKIVSFIDQDELIEQILRHCRKWKESAPRPPPEIPEPVPFAEPVVDYQFFDPDQIGTATEKPICAILEMRLAAAMAGC